MSKGVRKKGVEMTVLHCLEFKKKTQYLYFRIPIKCVYLYFIYWSLPLQAYSKLLSLELNTKEPFFGASNTIIDVTKSTKLKITSIQYAIQKKNV